MTLNDKDSGPDIDEILEAIGMLILTIIIACALIYIFTYDFEQTNI